MRSILGTIVGLGLWVILRCALFLLRLPPLSRNARGQAMFGTAVVPSSGSSGPRSDRPQGIRVLVTGRVDSKNWCSAHLAPLIQAANVAELLLVIDGDLDAGPKTRLFPVPKAIGWLKPRGVVRSAWAAVVAWKLKPDIVMAYSFFPPGVFALLAARLTGSVAVVQLCGGPFELECGGYATDDPLVPAWLVRRLVPLSHRLCDQFDAIIVRGRKGVEYVKEHIHPGLIEVIQGSVDPNRFLLNGNNRDVDIAFVGRIVSIKQPDHVCEIARRIAQEKPDLRVVVAGQGPLLEPMKALAQKLGLQKNIHFTGHVENVGDLLTRSRVFLLTSRSEGLSIALAEAMTAGAVPVVANVGDLSELVINGQTGWLIQSGDFDDYAAKITALLNDERARAEMSANARQIALANNGRQAVANRWERLLAELSSQGQGGPIVSAPDNPSATRFRPANAAARL